MPKCTYNVRMITFEWNPSKARTNLKKHEVSFEEARSVFYDDNALQFFDPESSSDEDRFLMLGMSENSRVLLVCHCERDGDVIRIISARKAKPLERRYYMGETE